jgi:glycosyltransferase involved in cell wall biosynthesis
MNIALNIYPLKSGHKNRGIGYYTQNLLNNLKKDDSLNVEEFIDEGQLRSPEVIHYPWFDLFFRTLPQKRLTPTVVTVHDVIPLLFPKHYPVGFKGRVNLFLQKIALKKCNYLITDSNSSKKDIVEHLKIIDSKIKIVPLAADAKFKILKDTELLRIKRQYNLPNQFLLYVGDVNWVKNIPFLIEGYKKLKDSGNFPELKLVLVGAAFLKRVENINHPELESIKRVNRLIQNLNLEDCIIRPGRLEDEELVAFYNLATAYVQPSLYEGFGLPVLQALSCGVPVISSNAGSLKEVGGDAAIYFNPTNIDQFVSTVADVLQSRSFQDKLSKLGLKQAANFSWEKTTEQTKRIYLDALKEKKNG